VETVAEIVADLVIVCSGGGAGSVTVTATLNTPITNNEVKVGFIDAGIDVERPYLDPPYSTVTYYARRNGLYEAEWDNIPIDPPGSTNVLHITNLRGSAGLILSSTLTPPTPFLRSLTIDGGAGPQFISIDCSADEGVQYGKSDEGSLAVDLRKRIDYDRPKPCYRESDHHSTGVVLLPVSPDVLPLVILSRAPRGPPTVQSSPCAFCIGDDWS
jgi:hypothetical protein